MKAEEGTMLEAMLNEMRNQLLREHEMMLDIERRKLAALMADMAALQVRQNYCVFHISNIIYHILG